MSAGTFLPIGLELHEKLSLVELVEWSANAFQERYGKAPTHLSLSKDWQPDEKLIARLVEMGYSAKTKDWLEPSANPRSIYIGVATNSTPQPTPPSPPVPDLPIGEYPIGEWVNVEGSSNVKRVMWIGQPEERGELQVEFLNGGQYVYYAVQYRVFTELLASESKGKFLNRHVLNQYECDRLDKPMPTKQETSDLPPAHLPLATLPPGIVRSVDGALDTDWHRAAQAAGREMGEGNWDGRMAFGKNVPPHYVEAMRKRGVEAMELAGLQPDEVWLGRKE